MPVSFLLFIILVTSFAFGKIANKFHFSEAIGMILSGLVLSYFLGGQFSGHEELIFNLSYLGLFALMFVAGFEISWNMLNKEKTEAAILTISTFFTSFILGASVFYFLDFSLLTSLVVGICFGITAEATKARVLMQLKKMNTRLGTLLIGTGIINDIIGVVFFSLIVYVFTDFISLAEFKILAMAIVSFLAGALVHYMFDRYSRGIRIVESFFTYLIIPFFFVNIGLYFSFIPSFENIKILFLVIFVGALGQLLGSFLTKPITKLSFKKLFLVGWGMNSKGAVELAIAFMAFQMGILPENLYSALVASALFSTFLFQIIIFRMVGADPEIMD